MRYTRAILAFVALCAVGASTSLAMDQAEVKAVYAKGDSFSEAQNYPKAIEQFDKILDSGKLNGDEMYNIACTYSLAGQKDKAVAVLQKAVAAGWNTSNDAQHMKFDTDLDNIRNEPAFKQIVTDLEAKAPLEAAATAYWQNPHEKKVFGSREYELVGTPTDRVSRTETQGAHTLCVFNGRVYLGSGGYAMPTPQGGEPAIISFDPGTGEWRWDMKVQAQRLVRFRVLDGDLFVPGHLADEGFRGTEEPRNDEYASLYCVLASGGFVKYRTIPDAQVLADICKLGNDYYALTMAGKRDSPVGWAVLRSQDGCLSWDPAYEFAKFNDSGIGQQALTLAAFNGRLYLPRSGLNTTGKAAWEPDAFGGKDMLVGDGTSWSESDLIQDKGLLRTVVVGEVAGKLVLMGGFAVGPGPAYPDNPRRAVMYAYDGTGTAKRVYGNAKFSVSNVSVADGAAYILAKDGAVLRSDDATKYTTLLKAPKELDVESLTALGGYLYLGTTKGEIYRTKL